MSRKAIEAVMAISNENISRDDRKNLVLLLQHDVSGEEFLSSLRSQTIDWVTDKTNDFKTPLSGKQLECLGRQKWDKLEKLGEETIEADIPIEEPEEDTEIPF